MKEAQVRPSYTFKSERKLIYLPTFFPRKAYTFSFASEMQSFIHKSHLPTVMVAKSPAWIS